MPNKITTFHPSLYEVDLANHVFRRELGKFEEGETISKELTENIAVRCSIAKVWERARMYQEEMEVSTWNHYH